MSQQMRLTLRSGTVEGNCDRIPMKKWYPLVGILASVGLFALSAAYYPGGYDWRHHYISKLFAATTRNGAPHSARQLAVAAMFIFSVSVGLLFRNVSRNAGTKLHRMMIEIAGIGSTLFACLAVTPMHNLLVRIALLFFVTAMLGILHLLYVERQRRIFCTGLICLVLLLTSVCMYYAHVFFGFLPLAQKLLVAVYVGWMFALQFVEFKTGKGET